MTVLRICPSPWLPAASLLFIAATAQASGTTLASVPLDSANAAAATMAGHINTSTPIAVKKFMTAPLQR